MAIKRLVGIDFGTSTSVVKCKRYEVYEENSKLIESPVGNADHVDHVTFGQGVSDPRAITLVRDNGNGTFDCGTEDLIDGSVVYREFKMQLESENEEEKQKARELTHEYMKYLYKRYSHQKRFFGESDDEETIISFPAKWRPETRHFMACAATDAGFENVSCCDEPSAALMAILAQEMNNIRDNELIEKGKDNLILVIDMGAGTTDLAVCRCNIDTEDSRVTAGNIKNELMFSWPPDDVNITFGGREIDESLKKFLIEYLVSCGLHQEIATNFINNNKGVKEWKEETLSPVLARNQVNTVCTVASQALTFAPNKKAFPEITRSSFEKLIEDKIEDYKSLVIGCLDKLEENTEIDVVIFTGGHSGWYFAKELVDGTMAGIDHPALKKVQSEKKRVFSLSHPQETVALGLVYSKLPFDIIKPPVEMVEVPDFVNSSLDESVTTNGNFTVKSELVYSETVEEGLVISQSIDAGETVEKGSEIILVISRGKKIEVESELAELILIAERYLEENKELSRSLSFGDNRELRGYLKIPREDKIYCWIDDTLFLKGTKGFAITNFGFYYISGFFAQPEFIDWETFKKNVTISISPNDYSRLEFYIKSKGRYTPFIYNKKTTEMLHFFEGLQTALKTSDEKSATSKSRKNKVIIAVNKEEQATLKVNVAERTDVVKETDYKKIISAYFGEIGKIEKLRDIRNIYFAEISNETGNTLNFLINEDGIYDGVDKENDFRIGWKDFVGTDIIVGNTNGQATSKLLTLRLPDSEVVLRCNEPQKTAKMLKELQGKMM